MYIFSHVIVSIYPYFSVTLDAKLVVFIQIPLIMSIDPNSVYKIGAIAYIYIYLVLGKNSRRRQRWWWQNQLYICRSIFA